MSPEPTLSTIPLVSTRHAACSCEQLRLTVEGEAVRVSICHCLACQRRTGSVFGVQARFDAEQVTTEGTSRQYIRVSDEGEKRATFHFCPDCGATVFYTTEATPGIVAIPVGAFADPSRRRGRSGRSGDIRGCGFQTTSNTCANRRRGHAPGPVCGNVPRAIVGSKACQTRRDSSNCSSTLASRLTPRSAAARAARRTAV
jgi:hypothetical protein